MERASGIMLHVSSLPNKYGFGCFSKEAYDFVDFLAKSGQKYWQVLPLSPTNESGSPYQSCSVFAGNPCFIDLTKFLADETLEKMGLKKLKKMNFQRLYLQRIKILKYVYKKYCDRESLDNYKLQNAYWLKDYATFMALKDKYGNKPFYDFPAELKSREKRALENFEKTHQKQIDFYCFVQQIFFSQWQDLKLYANKKGIKIIGDVAFYPASDSCDIWAHTEEFCFDKSGNPSGIAGVPPDYFSEDGQLWGSPVYNVEHMKKTNYNWWVKRFEQTYKFYDVVKIDHFRGFESFWCVPPTETTAKNGKWVKGPGIALFKELAKHKVPEFIVEDLGIITPKVQKLIDDTGFARMKVFQFAFDGNPKNAYFPHNYDENCVAYVGTHDNNTFVGFLKEVSPDTLNGIKSYLGQSHDATYEELTDAVLFVMLNSRANLVVIAMQDLLYLDEKSRMNVPGTATNNWSFVLPQKALCENLEKRILNLTISANRA